MNREDRKGLEAFIFSWRSLRSLRFAFEARRVLKSPLSKSMNLPASGKKALKNPRKTAGVISSLLNIASWFTASPKCVYCFGRGRSISQDMARGPVPQVSQERCIFQVFEKKRGHEFSHITRIRIRADPCKPVSRGFLSGFRGLRGSDFLLSEYLGEWKVQIWQQR